VHDEFVTQIEEPADEIVDLGGGPGGVARGTDIGGGCSGTGAGYRRRAGGGRCAGDTGRGAGRGGRSRASSGAWHDCEVDAAQIDEAHDQEEDIEQIEEVEIVDREERRRLG
jgi:hypothetical protein